jgi:hypothetical protein
LSGYAFDGGDTLFDIENPKKLIGLFGLQPIRFDADCGHHAARYKTDKTGDL